MYRVLHCLLLIHMHKKYISVMWRKDFRTKFQSEFVSLSFMWQSVLMFGSSHLANHHKPYTCCSPPALLYLLMQAWNCWTPLTFSDGQEQQSHYSNILFCVPQKKGNQVWNDMSKWWLVGWTLLVREAWIVQNNQYSTLMQMPVHDITSCVQGTQDLQHAKFLVVLIEPQVVFDWAIISGWQQCNPFTFLLSARMLYFSVNIRRKSHSKQFLNRIQINHSSKSHPAQEKSNTRGTRRGPAIN